MPDLSDGETVEMKGSAAKPYILKNIGGVYSCTCPAWRNQSVGIERRSCKHLVKLRGDKAEADRIGSAVAPRPEPADGKTSTAPRLLLAQTWDNDANLADWWMSEKLDGVRAYWDGKQFLSRLGNRFFAPNWFIEHLPKTPLDGELWLARKSFQRTVSIVRRQDKSDLWRELAFVVFDAPAVDDVFEQRLAFLRDTLAEKKSTFVQILEQERFEFVSDSSSKFWQITVQGAETIVRWGRLGTDGQSQTKTYPDAAAANKQAEKLIAEKLGKGYCETAVA